MVLGCLFPKLDSPLPTLESLGKAVYFSVPQFPHCIMVITLYCWEDGDSTQTLCLPQILGSSIESTMVISSPINSGCLILLLPKGLIISPDTLLLLWGCLTLRRPIL